MKTKTEVINILKGTLAFLSTFYQKVNLVLSFLFILFFTVRILKNATPLCIFILKSPFSSKNYKILQA